MEDMIDVNMDDIEKDISTILQLADDGKVLALKEKDRLVAKMKTGPLDPAVLLQDAPDAKKQDANKTEEVSEETIMLVPRKILDEYKW